MVFFIGGLCSLLLVVNIQAAVDDVPRGRVIYPIPQTTVSKMIPTTWRDGCPVPIADLALLQLPYVTLTTDTGMVNVSLAAAVGELVVHRALADEVIDIFAELFALAYPVALMRPLHEFGGNDTLAMMHNNTGGFNCRPKTGASCGFSLHSYGCAVDVNTFTNPYVRGTFVTPPGSEPFANRSHLVPGTISPASPVRRAFLKRGWNWGGEWITRQDYQHFQKDRFCDMILEP
eukprot:TRINITY_DN67916_c0_g1_i1.p1 TRINITY_DN67916_c0_g1~~TRINITY_DN67916_c0_g1_i1.p1  ORF type:complete len:232 (+),score=25.99 TRINITY_DN67916_c0_g1_i1:105-800(+)